MVHLHPAEKLVNTKAQFILFSFALCKQGMKIVMLFDQQRSTLLYGTES